MGENPHDNPPNTGAPRVNLHSVQCGIWPIQNQGMLGDSFLVLPQAGGRIPVFIRRLDWVVTRAT